MTKKPRSAKAKRGREPRAAFAPRAVKTVTIHKAKTQLSRLIRGIAAGDVVIARGKTPVARLTAYPAALPKRRFGSMKGQFKFDESFFDPLPKEELDAWNT